MRGQFGVARPRSITVFDAGTTVADGLLCNRRLFRVHDGRSQKLGIPDGIKVPWDEFTLALWMESKVTTSVGFSVSELQVDATT